MSLPTAEIQTLTPGAKLHVFVLDASAAGGGITRFHAGTNALGTALVWQGNTYQPFPIIASGFEWNGKGVLPRPTVTVANVDGTVGLLVRDLADLCGCTLTRKAFLVKFLDAVNFPSGVNPTADPTCHDDDEIWTIDSKKSENSESITFELVAAFDMGNVRVPGRLMQATICPWVYKGLECAYAGGLATCNKTLPDCKTHFGATAALPYGGFPGTALIR